jgi:hypothetical protein
MKVNGYICDECSAERGASNHWWLLCVTKGTLMLTRWNDEFATDGDTRHYCGRACVQKAVERFMDELATRDSRPETL